MSGRVISRGDPALEPVAVAAGALQRLTALPDGVIERR
jgi:hypothetical protein